MRGNAPRVWKAVAIIIATASILGLAGCTGTPEKPVNTRPVVKAGPSAMQLLAKARNAIEAGEFGNASRLLQQLGNRSLNRTEQFERQLLITKLAILNNELTDEVTQTIHQSLENLKRQQFSATPAQRREVVELNILLQERLQNWWPAAQARINYSVQLTGQAKINNHDQIWFALQRLSPAELSKYLTEATNVNVMGWLKLALLNTNQPMSLDQQLSRLSSWRTRNPAHPAAITPPSALARLQSDALQKPEKVAVLLPLSGPLARSGEAIRDGIMASYFSAKRQGLFAPELLFMDSQTIDSLDSAYAEALLAGAKWVIGPVSKNNVQSLAQREALSLPTVALNYDNPNALIDEYRAPETLFQFGLAPEDEAQEIAERAWADGLRHALVMIPTGGWGERILEAFRLRWEELGGTINEVHFYGKDNLKADVGSLLNIDSSEQRHKRIRRFMSEDLKFEPRRRQDADWVFIAADPATGRQVKPILAFNFAGDLPVYSTSRIYGGQPDSRDGDLSGVRFCDQPWVLDQTELYQEVENSLERGQGPYIRLYALGADAYWLPARLNQIQESPGASLSGSTGTLKIDGARRLHRRGECAIFRNGAPVQMPRVEADLASNP